MLKKVKNHKDVECRNCGFPLNGEENFCPNCGQKNDFRRINLGEMISQFFSGFFAFDNLFFRTLKPLLFKPGRVSKEYIEGKRKRYMNPFQLFLHTSIVFFIVLGLLNTIEKYKELNAPFEKEFSDDVVFINENGDYDEDLLETLYIKQLDSVFNHKFIENKAETFKIQRGDSVYNNLLSMGVKLLIPELDLEQSMDVLETFNLSKLNNNFNTIDPIKKTLNTYLIDKGYMSDEIDSVNNVPAVETTGSKIGVFVKYSKENPDINPVVAMDSLNMPRTKYNIFLYKKSQEYNEVISNRDNVSEYFNKLVSKTSIALFFLLPVFTLFFWILYLDTQYNYTEHLVVVFNIQTVFFIILLLCYILDFILKTDIFKSLFVVVFLFYLYKTLRNFYRQGRFKTVLKISILTLVYFFVSVFGLVAVSFLVFLF